MRHLRVNESNANAFDVQVRSHGGVAKFYHPECGYCKDMAPAWDALEGHTALVNTPVLILDVHSEAIPHIKSSAAKNIAGFPTIVEVLPGGSRGREYSGDRSTEDIARFILETMKRGGKKRKSRRAKRRKTRRTRGGRKRITRRRLRHR